jgi:hypothetical protein
MVSLTPTERLEWLLGNEKWSQAYSSIRSLIANYESFLKKTDAHEDEIVQQILNGTFGGDYLKIDSQLGDLVRDALDAIGQKNPFHRLLVV